MLFSSRKSRIYTGLNISHLYRYSTVPVRVKISPSWASFNVNCRISSVDQLMSRVRQQRVLIATATDCAHKRALLLPQTAHCCQQSARLLLWVVLVQWYWYTLYTPVNNQQCVKCQPTSGCGWLIFKKLRSFGNSILVDNKSIFFLILWNFTSLRHIKFTSLKQQLNCQIIIIHSI